MKTLDEMTRLSAEDLERISLDESIPVPEELASRVQEAVRPRTRRWALPATGIAAAAVAVLVTIGLTREPAPKDTFDDPYLAYAAVEQALSRVSGHVNNAAAKVAESEAIIDKVNYWK